MQEMTFYLFEVGVKRSNSFSIFIYHMLWNDYSNHITIKTYKKKKKKKITQLSLDVVQWSMNNHKQNRRDYPYPFHDG